MLGGIDLTNKNRFISLLISCIIFFPLFFSCFTGYAQENLQITGPVEAFESEKVEFLVTLDGVPIQARVTFGDSLFVNWTNSLTGKIEFTMPSVPVGDLVYRINASVPGGLNASYNILVKNKTGLLNIEFSTDTIIETTDFYIIIKDRNEPVPDATIWFNSAKYISDANGKVDLTAPDVLVTTNYGITVNKTGHKSNTSMVTIKEAGLGLQLMEIIYPSIVESEEKNIDITVVGKNGGLDNVTLEVYYEDIKHTEYMTDYEGHAVISAPLLNNENYFSLYISKEGYSTYNSNKKIIISLFTRDLGSDLDIAMYPSEVYEGDTVTVEVTDEIGHRIEDAVVWKGALKMEEATDSNGLLEFIAPSVFFDKEFYVYALKKGYNFAAGKITIRDRSSFQKKINIEMINVINESVGFYVSVKDENNIPLEKATVTFISEEKVTHENGTVYLTAPNITADAFYTLNATKYGYIPATVSIQVLDIYGDSTPRTIEIFIIPFIMENNEFTVTIRNEHGDLLSDAKVTFMDTTLITDYKGTVTFVAPDVNWDRVEEILVSKSGFESISAEITIKNNEGFEYWLLLLIIVIIFIIGLIAFFKYGRII